MRPPKYLCVRYLLAPFLAIAALTGIKVTSGVASPLCRNARWAVHAIGAELINNAFVRPLSIAFGRGHEDKDETNIINASFKNGNDSHNDSDGNDNDKNEQREIAIVTGATGGIGTEICHGLLSRNYHVFVLARNVHHGQELAHSLGPHATFVEYHADQFDSVATLRSAVGNKPVAVLVNNAGIMGGPKSQTVKVNLFGPAVLTLSLLSSLKMQVRESDARAPPVVVNVGSSAHLRAEKVHSQNLDSDEIDTKLATYAESKLGLMQFSNVLRSALPWLAVVDAHPGLVWTPLLQNNLSGAKILERIGLSKLLYKTPKGGALTILAAVDEGRRMYSSTSSTKQEQIYFVNRKPGGYASEESRDEIASIELWKHILGPTVRKVVPSGYEVVQNNMFTSQRVCDVDGDSSCTVQNAMGEHTK